MSITFSGFFAFHREHHEQDFVEQSFGDKREGLWIRQKCFEKRRDGRAAKDEQVLVPILPRRYKVAVDRALTGIVVSLQDALSIHHRDNHLQET